MWDAFECVFGMDGLSAGMAWDRVWPLLKAEADATSFRISDKLIPGDGIGAWLRNSERATFSAENEEIKVAFATVDSFGISFLTICCKEPKSIGFWQELMDALNCDSLVSGRAFDGDTEFWQNAQDPIEYQAAGRSSSGLPMVSNGLPFPLEKNIIDISKNPYRRVLKSGYVESLGAVLWLTKSFVSRIGFDTDRLIEIGHFIQVEKSQGQFVRLLISDSATMQDLETLRSALYPQPHS